VRDETLTLAHGAGGAAMRELVETVILPRLGNPHLAPLEDQARLPVHLPPGARLALTTDAHVVTPLFFPGGDIGRLAVAGTVNDLAVGGAEPRHLTCALVIEEGLPLGTLERVLDSLAETAREAGVTVVAGDTKVVPRGAADGLFVVTTGLGVIPPGVDLGTHRIRPGDALLVSGTVGDHGAAITAAREDLGLGAAIPSDCRPLADLAHALLAASPGLRCLRDPTRGGLAALLDEFATASGTCLYVHEAAIPLREDVRGLCELLGLDPLHLACEGKLVAVVPAAEADAALAALRAHPAGRAAARIGTVRPDPAGQVVLETAYGGERLLDPPLGEPLPRIC